MRYEKLSTEKYWQAALADELKLHEQRKRQDWIQATFAIAVIIAITVFAAWQMPAWADLTMNYLETNGYV